MLITQTSMDREEKNVKETNLDLNVNGRPALRLKPCSLERREGRGEVGECQKCVSVFNNDINLRFNSPYNN